MKEASFWHPGETGSIQCDLCPHSCVIREGRTGRCGARGVVDGRLIAMTYGSISSAGLDPVEKKPLYHFCPGSEVYSIGSWGCNFRCVFCQNWSISQQVRAGAQRVTPEDVVRQARESGAMGIAYTYNEPIIGYEFVRDCVQAAREAGLAGVLVTNGYIQPAPAAELIPLIDAMNIDIKSMEETFYRKNCGAGLAPVLAFARQAVQGGAHVEITNLIIPGLNDGIALIRELAEWIRRELGERVPLHLSAYRPEYRLSVGATSPDILEAARSAAAESLTYVYVGNVRTRQGKDTICPSCGQMWVRREGYRTHVEGVRSGRCAGCGGAVDIVFRPGSVR